MIQECNLIFLCCDYCLTCTSLNFPGLFADEGNFQGIQTMEGFWGVSNICFYIML